MADGHVKTLYLCYFWLDTPLVQTQVLPYLRGLVEGGLKVHLLTFEREGLSPKEIEDRTRKLADEGISWYFLRYHKTPSVPATVFDVLNGARFARRLARKEGIDVFHGRVHIPMMMGWIANKFLRRKPKMLFDIRGFFPDEYVDAGIWRQESFAYKMVKYCERLLLRDSDAFVTLTEKAREILFPESKETGFDKADRPVEVVPCCVDLARFEYANEEMRTAMRRKLGAEDRLVIAYVGSFGGFYMTRETAAFYGVARENNAKTFALILTQTPREMIEPLLKQLGFGENDFFIGTVTPPEVPQYLSASDFALSFIKPSYSKLASSPTKNAEYLASGLPMVVNSGVGDTAEQVREDNTGVVIEDFSRGSFETAVKEISRLLSDRQLIAKRCRESARKRFDLHEVGGKRYLNVYRKLLQ